MTLQRALPLARSVFDTLKPHCERIEVAGSIRRRKSEVHDLEIVCIPKREKLQSDLYGYETKLVRSEGFLAAIASLGRKEKGNADGRQCRMILPEGIVADIFMAKPENWGYIFAIRTGSADYSHKVLARAWVRAGYKGEDGMLTLHGMPIPVQEEEDLFKMIGVQYVYPWFREVKGTR